MRCAGSQFDDVGQGSDLFARSRSHQMKLYGQAVTPWLLCVGLGPAHCPQEGPRRIKMRGLSREEPSFELADELLFLSCLLRLGKTIGVAVRNQLGGQRAPGTKKEKRHLFQTGLALRRQKPRPPFGARKVFAGEGELLEIILEQQPCALRIGARREAVQQLLAFAHGGFGVGQFPAQVSERTIGLGENRMMRVVPGRLSGPRTVAVSQ